MTALALSMKHGKLALEINKMSRDSWTFQHFKQDFTMVLASLGPTGLCGPQAFSEDASVDHGALAVTVHVFSQILRFIVGDLIF